MNKKRKVGDIMDKELAVIDELLDILLARKSEEEKRVRMLLEEEENRKRNIPVENIDSKLQKIELKNLVGRMIYSVTEFVQNGRTNLHGYDAFSVLPVDKDEFIRLKTEQKDEIFSFLSTLLDTYEMDEHFFYNFFNGQSGREINRIRYITKGIQPYIVSKEEETLIIEQYKIIYKNMLFDFLYDKPYDGEHFIENVKAGLSIFSIPNIYLLGGKTANFIRKILTRSFSKETQEKLQDVLYNWYQDTNQVFIHKPSQYDFQQLEPLFFLLNDTQKKELFDAFLIRSYKNLKNFENQVRRGTKYDNNLYGKILRTKERIVRIKELSKA